MKPPGKIGARRCAPPPDLEELGTILRHEINNPLTGILGNAELVLAGSDGLSADVRRRVETIVGLAVRLRDVVRNLEQVVNERTGQPPRP